MKTLNKIITVVAITAFFNTLYAQQEAMYTHYMYNTLTVNPAYAGSRDALTATLLHRSQWVSFDGAPNTQTFTLHTPLKSKHIGLGLSVTNDQIGPVKNTSMYVDFAYIMHLGEKSKLAMGLKGGANMMQAGLNTLALDNQNDVAFQNNINSRLLPNFGFGLYYYRERFYLGISTPKLLENDFLKNTSYGSVDFASEKRHYFLIAGSIFNLSDKLQLKPTGFLKINAAAPLEGDITTTFIYNQKILAGIMYRSGDALGALLGYRITNQFQIGYSFDWSYGLRTFKYNGGSHEIMLTYDFIFKDKEKVRSPRYF